MTRGFSGAPSLGIGADRSLAFGNYIDYIPITWLVSGATDRAREKKEKIHSAAPLNVTRNMLIAEAPTCSFIVRNDYFFDEREKKIDVLFREWRTPENTSN